MEISHMNRSIMNNIDKWQCTLYDISVNFMDNNDEWRRRLYIMTFQWISWLFYRKKEVFHEQFKKYYQNIVQNFTFRNWKGGKEGRKRRKGWRTSHWRFEPHTMCGTIITRKGKRHAINSLPPSSSTLQTVCLSFLQLDIAFHTEHTYSIWPVIQI